MVWFNPIESRGSGGRISSCVKQTELDEEADE